MKNRKTPMRTCVISRVSYPKNELTRVVVTKDGEVSVDPSGKKNGRGSYVMLSKANIEKARAKKILEKMLNVEDLTHIYNELENMCDE